MMQIKSTGTFMSAGVFSAIAASLCCIPPVIALFAGSTSMTSNFLWIAPARPFLIGLSIAILALAWYLKLKPSKTNDMDCNCETTKPSFWQSKTLLVIITVISVLMISFPLYAKVFYPGSKTVSSSIIMKNDNKQQVKFTISGMTCESCEAHVNTELSTVKGVLDYKTSYTAKSSLVSFDKSKVDVKTIADAIGKSGYVVKSYEIIKASALQVSFYEAPLVCAAAPSIGCGSKAKFLLLDLEKNTDAVEGAWLNKKGTIVAVKWKESAGNNKRTELINTVSAKHEIEVSELAETEVAEYAKNFPDTKEWYKGKEVDNLSREEAAYIAKKTIDGYKKKCLIKASFKKQFQADIETIYRDLFLSISSYKDLNTETYNKVEEQIQKAGEKYVGKGKMPYVELCNFTNISCDEESGSCEHEGKSCTKDKSGKSCCDQK